MAAPYYSLLDKASNALALYLRGEIPASASIIHPSKRALEKTPPCVVCEADNATSEILYSGRYIIDAVVTVSMVAASDVPESESGSDAAVSDSSELVGSVFDSLHYGSHGEGFSLATALSAQVADFTCFNAKVESISQQFADNVWMDILRLKLVCSPQDIS